MEEWRPIPGYEGYYEASSLGRIRSLDRWVEHSNGRRRLIRGQIRRVQAEPTTGHLRLGLSRDSGPRTHSVHSLVMASFAGQRPEDEEIRHLDGNPANNALSNLAYGTKSENMLDRVRHGTHHHARKTHCAHGHPFNEVNTYVTRSGERQCRTCKCAVQRACRERNMMRAAGVVVNR